MKQQYAIQPEAVETYRVGQKTDVILRKNIESVTLTDEESGGKYTAYMCDEKQFRYPGILYAEDIAKDFNTWWAYEPEMQSGDSEPADLFKAFEARLNSVEAQTTDIQLGMCEIFEMLVQ